MLIIIPSRGFCYEFNILDVYVNNKKNIMRKKVKQNVYEAVHFSFFYADIMLVTKPFRLFL